MTPKEKEIAGEMIHLIDNIKEHTDAINTRRRIPQLELELIVSKIKTLYEKSVTLKYLHAHLDEIMHLQQRLDNDPTPQTQLKPEDVPKQPKPIENQEKTAVSESPESALKSDRRSVNERLAKEGEENSLGSRLQKQKIDNLKSAIGLNEKFLFVTELFGGNKEEYANHIDRLDKMNSKHEAKNFVEQDLSEKFHWDKESATVKVFLKLVDRRFDQ